MHGFFKDIFRTNGKNHFQIVIISNFHRNKKTEERGEEREKERGKAKKAMTDFKIFIEILLN